MIAISFYDKTGAVLTPWAERGFTCYCVDSAYPCGEHRDDKTNKIIRVGADILNYLPPRDTVAFAAFFPPTADVFDENIDGAIGALRHFSRSLTLAKWLCAPYMIAYPFSLMGLWFGEHSHSIKAEDFNLEYTWRSHLWTGGGFVMPGPKKVALEKLDLTREIPKSFAEAVFDANCPKLHEHKGWTPETISEVAK